MGIKGEVMDIFILLIISIFVYLLPVNNDYLGVKSTTGLKGFLALGIVFHHLSQWITTGEEFSNFGYMGTYIVSLFFWLFVKFGAWRKIGNEI